MIRIPAVFLESVINLIREFDQVICRVFCSGKLFAQHNRTRTDRSKVESHMKVGRTPSALHVKHLHGVVGVIPEDVLSVVVLCEDLCQFFLDFFL